MDYGPGIMVTWYSKFITRTYSNSARTNLIAGPVTNIFESISPM
jgi:hypothetical protein